MTISEGTLTQHLGASGTSDSYTHVVEAGCTEILFRVTIIRSSGVPSAVTVTYNGVAMTLVAGTDQSNTTANSWSGMFYLLNPAVGSNTLAFSWTGTGTPYSSVTDILGSTQIPHNGNSWQGTGTHPTLAITSAVGELVLDHFTANVSINSTDQTQDYIYNSPPRGAASHAAGAATVTIGYTKGAGNSSLAGCSIAPDAAAAPSSGFFLFMPCP